MPVLFSALLLAAAPTLQLHASVDGKAAPPGWVYVSAGQEVELEARPSRPGAEVKWERITPTVDALDNTTPSFHFEPIRYAATELTECAGKLRCVVKARASAELGTTAYAVHARWADGVEAHTPGLEALDRGGLSRAVFRVAVRQDDSLLGYATELFGTPYIFGSAGKEGDHQADRLVGSDCADLIIYARRRLTGTGTYTSSYAIDQQAPLLKRDAKPQAGDLLHFPNSRHVGLLYEDRPPVGQITADDLMLHTCWAKPTIQRLGDTGCASEPVRLLRFPTAPSKR